MPRCIRDHCHQVQENLMDSTLETIVILAYRAAIMIPSLVIFALFGYGLVRVTCELFVKPPSSDSEATDEHSGRHR